MFFISCNDKEKSVAINQPTRDISLIQREIFQGDTSAYLELRNFYLDDFSGDFLFWALYMSNKHDYSKAHYDVFEKLVISYVGDITKFNDMDEQTKRFAKEYLLKAIKSGHKEAEDALKLIE